MRERVRALKDESRLINVRPVTWRRGGDGPLWYLPRPMRRYILITGVLSLGLGTAVGLAACGGDSTPETPIVVTDSSASLTKAEFLTQADAICDQANTQIADIANAGEGITRAADVANLRQGVITDVRALGTPIDDGSSISTGSSTDSSSTDSTSTVSTQDTSTFPSADTSTTSTDSTSTGSTGTSSTTGTGNDLEDFLTALGAEVQAGEKIDLAQQRGEDTSAAEAELVAAKDRAASAASAYGFLSCGSDGASSSAGASVPSSSTSTTGSSSEVPSSPSTVTPTVPSTGTSGGSSGSPTTSTSGTSGTGGGVSPGGGVGPG